MDTIKQNVIQTGVKSDEDFTFAVATVERRVSTRRSSLFGLQNRSTSASPPAKSSKSEYEHALLTECKQWNQLIQQSMRYNASIVNQPLKITMDDLTIDQTNYIAAAPDFKLFQAEGVQFVGRATMYMQLMENFEQHKTLLLDRIRCELRMASICLARQF